MATDTAVKTAPAIGLKDWIENVRTLAPEARIPYIVQIMAEAYETGLTPPRRQCAAAAQSGPINSGAVGRYLLGACNWRYRRGSAFELPSHFH